MTSICLIDFALVLPSTVSQIHSLFILQMSVALKSPWLSRAFQVTQAVFFYKHSSKNQEFTEQEGKDARHIGWIKQSLCLACA